MRGLASRAHQINHNQDRCIYLCHSVIQIFRILLSTTIRKSLFFSWCLDEIAWMIKRWFFSRSPIFRMNSLHWVDFNFRLEKPLAVFAFLTIITEVLINDFALCEINCYVQIFHNLNTRWYLVWEMKCQIFG